MPAAPIEITSGGLYRGWWRSTNPAVPAVTISTTQPVLLAHSRIDHAGAGIWAQATTGTNVQATDTALYGLNPGSAIDAPAIYFLEPATLVVEYCKLKNGQGVTVDGNNIDTTLLRVKFNDYIDIGRWNTSVLAGAFHGDKLDCPNGADIGWNRIRNRRGFSVVEDCIGLTQCNGASGAPIDVHHNLVDGCYPYTGDGADYTGGGIDLGDLGGSWQDSHHNTVVRYTNNGLMIPAGSNLHHHHNKVVGSGVADDSQRCSSSFGAGITIWDNPDPEYPAIVSSDTHDNQTANGHGVDHRRWTGSAWECRWFDGYFLPNCDPGTECTGGPLGGGPTNEQLGLLAGDSDATWLDAVDDALAAWEAMRAAASVTIGPR